MGWNNKLNNRHNNHKNKSQKSITFKITKTLKKLLQEEDFMETILQIYLINQFKCHQLIWKLLINLKKERIPQKEDYNLHKTKKILLNRRLDRLLFLVIQIEKISKDKIYSNSNKLSSKHPSLLLLKTIES